MRVFFTRHGWISVGVMCLSLAFTSGCKSTSLGSGMGWLGWMNPKASASSLSSTPPTKPSVAMLPNPSATTGATAQGVGASNSLATYPSGAGHVQAPAGQLAPGNYSTGPYGMSGQANAQSSGALPYNAAANAYGNNYGAGAAHPLNQTPAYGGYQSPYGANNAAARTADSRSVYGAPDGGSFKPAPHLGSQPAANPSVNSWNGDQWSKSGGVSTPSGTPAGYNDAGSQRGYDDGSWNPPAANGGQSSYLDRADNGSANTAGQVNSSATPRRDGPFRPGSTNRNGGSLPANAAATAQAQTGNSSNYPSTAYPSTGYPSMDPASRTANGAGPYGGNGYQNSLPVLR